MKNEIEFETKYKEQYKKIYIKNLNIYNEIVYEEDNWFKDKINIKLYYYQKIHEEDYIQVEKTFDEFSFNKKDKEKVIELYEKIKEKLKKGE